MWKSQPPPPWKKSPPLSQQPSSKGWGPVKPLPLTMSSLQERCFIQKGSQNLKCWLMLLFIANRANMWVWLTMLTNIYLKFNKCWPIFFDFFFFPNMLVNIVNCTNMLANIFTNNAGSNVGMVCEDLKHGCHYKTFIMKTFLNYLSVFYLS